MDLKNLDMTGLSDQPQPYTVLHPQTFLPTDLVLSLTGRESTRLLQFRRAVRDELMVRATQFLRDGKVVPPLSEEEKDRLEAREAAACIVGWQNMEFDGVQLPYSEQAAQDQMLKYPWLRRQVLEAYREDERFFPSLPSASSTGQSTTSDSTESSPTEQPSGTLFSKLKRALGNDHQV